MALVRELCPVWGSPADLLVQQWATKVLQEDAEINGFVQLLEGKAKVKKP